MLNISLKLLKERFAICKCDQNMPIPMWVLKSRDFYSITRTADEMSIVSFESSVPADVEKNGGWRAFMVEGISGFSQIGIISSITGILAENGIPVFCMSTYNTDYIFVKEENLEKSAELLKSRFTVN